MLHKYIKGIIVCFLLLFFFSSLTKPAFAESSGLKVTMKEGLDGKVKRGSGFPIQIIVENSGDTFSGDLLIDFYPSYNTGGSVAVHLGLPEKTTKTYQVSIPGMTEDHPALYQNSAMIHLYEGDWQDGKKVEFEGQKTLKLRYIDPSEKVLGVLSENMDRLKELKSLPAVGNYPIETIQLEKELLPEQALGLEMVDYIVVDEFALSQLNDPQQEALQQWILAGGILVAGGAPNASQSYGAIYSLLPMKVEGQSRADSTFLQDGKRDNPNFSEVDVFNGTVEKEATILFASSSTPVVLKKKYGEGTILQTGFSLGDEPLSAWNGYSNWFSTLLQEAQTRDTNASKYGQDIFQSLYYEFAEVNEFFPVSHLSMWQLIGFLLAYLVIIAPVLYFVLRKWDKREHAWWIIPVLAITVSVVVFAIGAKDRLAKPQLNQMGIFKAENGQLSGYQAATLLSNKGGNYQFAFPKNQFKAIPSTDMMSATPKAEAVYEETRKANHISFRNVEYWSSRTIYGSAKKAEAGSFQTDLTVNSTVLSGTITNHFDYDFKEIFIWSGNEQIKLGSLQRGETLNVNEKVKQSLLTAPAANMGYNMSTQNKLNEMKKDRLLSAASTFIFGATQMAKSPVIVGITDQEVISVDLAGKDEKQNNDNLIVEPFTAKGEITGKITISNEALASRFNVIKGQIYQEMINTVNEVMMDDGEYEYILLLPQIIANKQVTLERISIRLNGPTVKYEILNQQSGQFEPIEQESLTLTVKEGVGEYLSQNGEILLKMYKNGNGDPYVSLPNITIKGEVAP